MMRLYLVRHGEVATDGMHYGQLDVPLSPRGRRQAESVAETLASLSLDAVYSSDLERARIGAQLIADRQGLSASVRPAFREMHLGVLEGVTHEESQQRYPELFRCTYRDLVDRALPEGEDLRGVAKRVLAELERVREDHPEQTVALVAHNSVNRIVLAQALGLPLTDMFDFRQDFGCVNQIDFDGSGAEVALLNWRPSALAPERG